MLYMQERLYPTPRPVRRCSATRSVLIYKSKVLLASRVGPTTHVPPIESHQRQFQPDHNRSGSFSLTLSRCVFCIFLSPKTANSSKQRNISSLRPNKRPSVHAQAVSRSLKAKSRRPASRGGRRLSRCALSHHRCSPHPPSVPQCIQHTKPRHRNDRSLPRAHPGPAQNALPHLVPWFLLRLLFAMPCPCCCIPRRS
ncbi:hypothetical protein BJ912DRAFT_89920 [Pholiota molesta]|nr:hypothetical protein BJ912DRAFT_89920 [Pholiota molesta]